MDVTNSVDKCPLKAPLGSGTQTYLLCKSQYKWQKSRSHKGLKEHMTWRASLVNHWVIRNKTKKDNQQSVRSTVGKGWRAGCSRQKERSVGRF